MHPHTHSVSEGIFITWVSRTPASVGCWSCIISQQSSEADSPEPLTFHRLLTAGCPVPAVSRLIGLHIWLAACFHDTVLAQKIQISSYFPFPVLSAFFFTAPHIPLQPLCSSLPLCRVLCDHSDTEQEFCQDQTAATQLTCPALSKPFFLTEGQTNPGQGEHHSRRAL